MSLYDYSRVIERIIKFEIHDVRVNMRVVNPEAPTGLAHVCYTQQNEEVNVKVADTTHKRIGTIMWTKASWGAGYAWSLGEVEGFWNVCNTLGAPDGKRWVFHTGDNAFKSMANYIKLSLYRGPHDWKTK